MIKQKLPIFFINSFVAFLLISLTGLYPLSSFSLNESNTGKIKNNFKKFTQVQYLMGTLFRIELYTENKTSADKAFRKAFGELRKYDLIMSNYRSDSELAQVLKTAHLYPTYVSPELCDIFRVSLNFSAMTNGYFDVSVGPLVRLWGFKNKNFRIPSVAEIAGAKEKVGYTNIYLNPFKRTIFLKKAGMEIDFGAIGKGYAIDRAVQAIKSEGIISGVIDSVSNQYYIGSRPDGSYWRVAVKHPRKENEVIKFLMLKDRSVSTSGDYEQFFIENGIRYSHIINPLTGFPLKSKIAASTVVLNNAADADAISTSLLLLNDSWINFLLTRFNNIQIIKIINQDKKLKILDFKN